MKKQILIVVILFLAGINLYAQFTVSGEYRPRTEYNHGLKKLAAPGQESVIWTAQRTRLNFDFSNEFVRTRLTLQDVRTWGSQPQLNATDGLTSIHEAWAQVALTDKLSLKAGRQEIVYDDHRIFGNVGWTHQSRSHDAAIFKYSEKDKFDIDLGIAYNQNQTPAVAYTVGSNYKALQYLWFHKKLSDKGSLSLLFLNNGAQLVTPLDSVTNDYSIIYNQTAGGRLNYNITGNLSAVGAFYYQMGKDAANNDLSAYYINAEATYKLLDKKAKITAGLEYLTGTDQNSTSGNNNSFTPFYGTNHKFNGHMDYFYVGNHANSVGLQDIYFKAAYAPGKFSTGLDVHLFSAVAQVFDNTTSKAYDGALGTEIDFSLGYKLNDIVSFKGGYSQMLGTSSLAFIRGGSENETSNWGWLMMSVTPKFFESK